MYFLVLAGLAGRWTVGRGLVLEHLILELDRLDLADRLLYLPSLIVFGPQGLDRNVPAFESDGYGRGRSFPLLLRQRFLLVRRHLGRKLVVVQLGERGVLLCVRQPRLALLQNILLSYPERRRQCWFSVGLYELPLLCHLDELDRF